MTEKNLYSHQHYTYVDDQKDADAVAWTFLSADKFEKFPFKFETLGDDEIRANITHTGLCHADALCRVGQMGPPCYPVAPGHEVIAIVSHVGKNVTNFKVGDRVGFGPMRDSCDNCTECKRSYDNLCGKVPFGKKALYGEYWGGFATSIQQPAKWAFKIPEALPSDQAPPILCAGVTVYTPLSRFAKAGDRVGVIGIGGLGHMAVQYASKMGCHVTALSSTKAKEEQIKKLGAERVLSSTDPEELKSAEREFDVIINTLTYVDNKMLAVYLSLVAGNGTFVQVGAPPHGEPLQIEALQLILSNINFAGNALGSRKDINACLEFSAKHKILPMCEFFEFEDFPKAFDVMENGRPQFRCVVNVEEWSKKNGFYKK